MSSRSRRSKFKGLCTCSLSKICWIVVPLSLFVLLSSGRNLADWRQSAARSEQASVVDGPTSLLELSSKARSGGATQQLPAAAPRVSMVSPPTVPPGPPPEVLQSPPPIPAPTVAAPAPAYPAEVDPGAPIKIESLKPTGDKDPVWVFCAEQWQECWCRGTIRWGLGQRWHEIKPKEEGQELRVKCSVDKLPDVAPGESGKHCQCSVRPGSAFHKSLNPALLRGGGAAFKGLRLATSCEQLEDAAGDEGPASALWEAVEPMCSTNWQDTAPEATKAGPQALSQVQMHELMLSWIDPRFDGNYAKYFDTSGWANRGFVNYFAGPPGGKHTKMTEELIKSVHLFSKEPIVVIHFGFATPTSWSAERFPQLVLLHAAPLPVSAHRSFNFNKFRAMLLSRLRVGVQLDSDQFVAPGVDAMFQRTSEEITKDYPFPILPVHFLDRSPKDQGAYWARYCPQDQCKFQTARWGHAHPTWTFWALPFLGRWLRRNFRDETLPTLKGGEMRALRVIDIPEDEDLLNVGTWEEGGTKQWCKIDLPGPGDFEAVLNSQKGSRECGHWSCGNIGGDRRFHPKGAAKAFYTAHHAVEPGETRRYVQRLKEKFDSKSLPPPILFQRKFYATGQEMKAANPDATCII